MNNKSESDKPSQDEFFYSHTVDVSVSKTSMPENENNPEIIKELIQDELLLDGNARQNLATFCQTFHEKQVHELMDLSISKNMIDKDEYPQTTEIEMRCVKILAELWNSKNAIGTSTIGSSEACMLGGLAMLYRWRDKMKAMGKDSSKPNMVCGPVQVCWHKFALYWDVELREVPMEVDCLHISPKSMLEYVDENTIGVVTTFGLTFTGKYEPVKELADALDKLEEESGLDIDLHVDAASGGFLAPFCAPDLLWDFRIPRVKSISASGHKYGLAPLGSGWALWRERKDLPDRLIFHVNYLGGDMSVFQLNFSRPAGQVISQYYLFLRLGMEGYRKIHEYCYYVSVFLGKELDKIGIFKILYSGDANDGIPCVTWTLKDESECSFNLYDFAEKLLDKGWQVPAYSLPKNAEEIVVQRIVVRRGFSIEMAELLIKDVISTIDYFKENKFSIDESHKKLSGFIHN